MSDEMIKGMLIERKRNARRRSRIFGVIGFFCGCACILAELCWVASTY